MVDSPRGEFAPEDWLWSVLAVVVWGRIVGAGLVRGVVETSEHAVHRRDCGVAQHFDVLAGVAFGDVAVRQVQHAKFDFTLHEPQVHKVTGAHLL